jgi:hypothetical protein
MQDYVKEGYEKKQERRGFLRTIPLLTLRSGGLE